MLQDRFLNELRQSRIPVTIYLTNGVRLQGTVASFDQYGILISGSTAQMLYKSTISTIIPERDVASGSSGKRSAPADPAAPDSSVRATETPVIGMTRERKPTRVTIRPRR